MFESKEDLIERLNGKDPNVIIKAVLEELKPYQVARIARKVLPDWKDNIKYQDLCDLPYLRNRLENGQAECVLCGFTDDISSVYAHVQKCEVLIGLSKQCRSEKEFYDYLQKAYSPKNIDIRKIRE